MWHRALRGRIAPATRFELRDWLSRFEGRDAVFATEGCTGWLFVVEELRRAGVEAHLVEPANTATLRDRKLRAKTDRADACLLRRLLLEGCQGTGAGDEHPTHPQPRILVIANSSGPNQTSCGSPSQ